MSWTPVRSGVPQGSVSGSTLFLIYINDIAEGLNSTIRLFADDCILYREIKGQDDHHTLQKDLTEVFNWADKWQMSFNASKCQSLSITRKKSPSLFDNCVSGQVIEQRDRHKYLGVTISSDLTFKHHIANIRANALATLGIIRRNLGPCSKDVQLKAYQALVRPQLEYSAATWSPHTACHLRLSNVKLCASSMENLTDVPVLHYC